MGLSAGSVGAAWGVERGCKGTCMGPACGVYGKLHVRAESR